MDRGDCGNARARAGAEGMSALRGSRSFCLRLPNAAGKIAFHPHARASDVLAVSTALGCTPVCRAGKVLLMPLREVAR